MTEQNKREAELLDKLEELSNDSEVDMYSVATLNAYFEECKDVISGLFEEIQQYRAIRTVETIMTRLAMLEKYESIDTIENLQALKEKSVAKKPIDISRVRDSDGYIGLVGKCPCCEDIVEEDTLYCDCGQHLDWE